MPITFAPTASWLFKKPPQFVEETAYGVTPASPAFAIMGSITDINPSFGIRKEVVRSVGNRDANTQTKMMEVFTGAFKYRPFDTTFMKYGVNLPDEATPAGTNAASVTIIWSQLINNVEKYFILQGCKTDKISIEVSKDGGVVVGQDLQWYKSYTFQSDLTAIGVTTPTFVTTTPTTQPWSSLTGGVDPFTIGGTAWPVDRFKLDVNQNLFQISPNGSLSAEFLGAGVRDISVDFDTWTKDSVLYDNLMNLTLVNAVYTLNAGVTPHKTITLSNIGFDSRSSPFSGSSKEPQREGIKGTPLSVTLN